MFFTEIKTASVTKSSSGVTQGVEVWAIAMVTDPEEVGFYRGGGLPSDTMAENLNFNMTRAVNGAWEDKKKLPPGSQLHLDLRLSRPVVVVAAGLRFDPALRGSKSAKTKKTVGFSSKAAKNADDSSSRTNSGRDCEDAEIGRLVPFLVVYDMHIDTSLTSVYGLSQVIKFNSDDDKKDDLSNKRKRGESPSVNIPSKDSSKNWPGGGLAKNCGAGGTIKTKSTTAPTSSLVAPPKDGKKSVPKPSCFQCIPLPNKATSIKLGMAVSKMVLSPCGRFLVVCLSQSKEALLKEHNDDIEASSSPRQSVEESTESDSAKDGALGRQKDMLLVYSVLGGPGGVIVKIVESPCIQHFYESAGKVPVDIIDLPVSQSPHLRECSEELGCHCLFASACIDGVLRIFSIRGHETSVEQEMLPPPATPNDSADRVSGSSDEEMGKGSATCLDLSLAGIEKPSSKEMALPRVVPDELKFTRLVFCHVLGLDRLSACQQNGSMILINLSKPEELDTSGDEDEEYKPFWFEDDLLRKASSDDVDGAEVTIKDSIQQSPSKLFPFLLTEKTLCESTLASCLKLTTFSPGCPRLSVTAPTYWIEITQSLQQRRNAQHLHQHQSTNNTFQSRATAALYPHALLMGPMEATRTWTLDLESNSWDEHVFELLVSSASTSVPKNSTITVGQITVKLLLAKQKSNESDIEVNTEWNYSQ